MGKLTLALILLCAGVPASSAGQSLSALFQESVVVQRDASISVWGTATPGESISVELAGSTATTVVDSSGDWSLELPPLAAGGPYTLVARSSAGTFQTVSDVLIGDVFLCSGQSNMELPVSRALNSPSEIRAGSHDRIRMLQVGHASSAAPQEVFPRPVAWQVATPETVGNWSAACYFFARELQKHVDVPIGLISASWGGSDIRAWISDATLAGLGGYDDSLNLLRLYADDEAAAQRAFGERWQDWWRGRTGDDPGTEPWQPAHVEGWAPAPEGLGDWKEWGISELRGFNGMVWFRASFELTASQAGQDAALALGGIDEVDQTWINGNVVGNTFGWGTERTYAIPADQLREGENVVVVNLLNTWGAGGMVGDPALQFEGGGRVPLNEWHYLKVPAEVGMPPRTPWESVAGLSTIHNAMVAPLGGYGLKGVLWYQGESNTHDGLEYGDMLQALMAQWRGQFGSGLPVLVVQLANYGRLPTSPRESGWAEVREAQRLAVARDPHAGLAVAIDIGDSFDIHPPNKQELGRRLVRAARHVVYGEAVAPSGPVPIQAIRESGSVAVAFGDVEGDLVAYGHERPIGFELCGTDGGSCRYVDARVDGKRVILDGSGERVRYCWADSPICTLYDGSGLPAGPFELVIGD